ncbi:MAG: EamA family transporter [Alphaproteobacteria bacterium]|nr:EamA family transporter [Alphaproteobacteria bacterium]
MSRRVAIGAGFIAIYAIWGSTYLATRLAIETLPPFLMMGVRSLVGGALLCAIAGLGGTERPTAAQWRGALVVGLLFFVGCHGVMAYAQRSVPSGLAALLMATLPLWVPLIGWLRGTRPQRRTVIALMVGFAGVALLLGVSRGLAPGGVAWLPVAALLGAAVSWALGSVLSRAVALPPSATQAAGLELLLGGAALVVLGLAGGEAGGFALAAVSARSLFGLAWLTLGGSVVAFAIYGWLLRVVPPERVATYAYVNPVIAVALGATLLGETVTPAMVAASALILAAVVVALTDRLPTWLTDLWPRRLARRTS